jgi:hypothetical protein
MPPTPRAISRESEPVGKVSVHVLRFAEAHDGTVAVAFEDVADGFV